MKPIKIALTVLAVIIAASCGKKHGDNSDFDFSANRGVESPYKDGFGRLPNSVRLASYNVHGCEGPVETSSSVDRSHYDKTALVISLMDPDFISIQEIDENTTKHPTSQITELATRTGLHGTFGRARYVNSGEYGVGILSKKTPVNTVNLPIPQVESNYETRTALFAEFDDCVFIATHFCHKSSKNRKLAVEFISEEVASRYGANFTKPVYLAGDLNEDKVGSEVMLELQKNWTIITSNDYTMNSVRIDYVLIYTGNAPSYKVLGAAVPVYDSKTIDIYTVSDHLPTFVDIEK